MDLRDARVHQSPRSTKEGERMSDEAMDARRLVVPSVAGLYGACAPYSHTLVRVALGLVLMPHGINKLFFGDAANAARTMAGLGLDPPLAWAYFIGVVEAFGGLMLILCLLPPVSAARVVPFMLSRRFP